jgi:DNA-binding MarR family transcriptional regulator
MNEVRRLTRVCGFLSRDAFGSGRSPLEWHVLNIIHKQPERASAAMLAVTLGTSHTTMTTVLNRLEKWGWVKRQLSQSDARARRLSLTEQGLAELLRVEQFGVALIERGLKRMKASRLEQFVHYFRAYTGTTEDDERISIGNTFSIGRLRQAELIEARCFVIEQRLKQDMLEEIPGYLLNDEHLNFAIRKGTEVVAVFEFRVPSRAADVELVQGVAIADGRTLKPAVIKAAYERICELLKQDKSLTALPDLTRNPQRLSRCLQVGARTF